MHPPPHPSLTPPPSLLHLSLAASSLLSGPHWGRFLTSEPSWGLHPFTHPSFPCRRYRPWPPGPHQLLLQAPMKVRVQGLKVALTVKLAQVTAPILPGATVLHHNAIFVSPQCIDSHL